jgi:hypothetical protein
MRNKILFTCILSAISLAAFSQAVENDDMYFTSKDRVKLKEQRAVAYSSARETKKRDNRDEYREESDEVNPTDSYSARNTNPEFDARKNAETAQEDNQDYYLQDYKYQNYRDLNNWNSNFNNWYGNSWYNSNYWSPSISGWNSPYYGNYYSAWGNPWNNPYYQSSWSSSFSYYWGSGWNYGWGGYNAWNCPWASAYNYPSYYGGGPGWGGYYSSMYGWGRPSTVVIINNGYSEGGRTVTYGKRPSRSTTVVNNQSSGRTRAYTSDSGSGGGRDNSGGRVASGSNSGYYDKTWRYKSPNSNTTNGSSEQGTRQSSYSNPSRTTSFGSSGNDSYQYQRSNSSNSSYNPSRSSGSSSGGGARSSTPPSSSGSNGRSRGSR